ncbi:ORF8 [Betabaculovirus altermyunipunctae]|uniref:ORF8 n=1 Tax=Betabaculovirus altermyunipunctae TaxID=3051996 RepID=A0A1S5YEC1_9BBAC|nr:ORF8 [Betabaculovirus altermyunipunctae]AQQ80278.1 ORF8 [Betabaculovirus altermyunipunctae]
MATIANLNVDLDFGEQEMWTKICEMFTYLSRVDDMDEEQWRTVRVLSDGFVALMNESNKRKVLGCINDLLSAYVERNQRYSEIV